MKPFRGKPEEPERSNGEIQRQRRWLGGGRRCRVGAVLAAVSGASRHRSSVSGVVVVHFSPSRTSRPVGCRSTARALACRVASRRTRQIPGRPTGCSAVSISKGIRSHTSSHSNCVGAAASVPWRLGRTRRRPKCPGSCWRAAYSDGQRRAPRGARPRYRSATLMLWVLSGPVLKHGPRSLTCARVIGESEP